MPFVARKHHDAFKDRVLGLLQQVDHQIDDLFGLDGLGDIAGIGIGLRIPKWRVNGAGTKRGDLNVVRDQLLGQRVGKTEHAVF